jgi:hypothetical protein
MTKKESVAKNRKRIARKTVREQQKKGIYRKKS